MLLSLFVTTALAADAPHLWFRQSIGVAGWPTGLLLESRLQARIPGHRTDGMVFNETYYGAGLRLDASPAFVNPGVTVALAPIDIFDVDLSAQLLGGLPGPFGLLPYDGLASKLEEDRDAREDHFSALGWSLDAAPTLKLKVGPIIAFDAVTVSWLHFSPPDTIDAPYLYEPLRDMIVAREELFLEHQPALLWEALPGGERPLLMIGATWRDRFAFNSGDRSGALGGLIVCRPIEKPAVPTLIGSALVYLIDQDRVGREPWVGVQASWSFERPFAEAPAAN